MIVQSVMVDMRAAEAFTFFAGRISEWWPADRRHTGDSRSRIFLEASGRFYERASNGREVELGKVTRWIEPQLIVIDFYIATGPDHPTEVEISFEEVGARTRVTVSHGPKPVSKHLWDERSPRYVASWQLVLAALVHHASS